MYMVVHPHVLVGVWPTCPCLSGGVAYMPMSLWGCGLHAHVFVGVWPTCPCLSGGVAHMPMS